MELEEIDLEIYDLKMRLHDLCRELDTRELYGIGDAIGDAFDFVDRAGHLLACHKAWNRRSNK